jgi:acetylornithine deacetylase/succinyl-diaminopimelate desuccinylase-like protein
MVDAAELAAFAAIPAPTGGEDARLHWLEARLARTPGTRERDEAGNLIWRDGEGPVRLLLMAHVDTVFPPSTTLRISREGDDLAGPGVGDNAAAVMAIVWTLGANAGLPAGLVVAFTVGEEGLGNLRGAIHACERLRPAAAVAVEGHGLDEVVVDHVGSVRARLRVSGPGGHSWWDRGTPSAIHGLAGLVRDLAGAGANVGTIEGGRSVNTIAGRAEALVEYRSLEQARLDAFEQSLDALSVDAPLTLDVTVAGRRPAGRTDPADPLVAAVRTARRGLRLPDRLGSGSTDANAAAALRIPAVAIGCTRGEGMHTERERISLSALELGCRQIAAIASP